MSLRRLGDSDTIHAIQARCKQLTQYYRDHPDEARKVEAKIDADREHFKAITATRATIVRPANDNNSRQTMRRKRIDED